MDPPVDDQSRHPPKLPPPHRSGGWRAGFTENPGLYVRWRSGPEVRVIPKWPHYTLHNTKPFSAFPATQGQTLAFEAHTVWGQLEGLIILMEKMKTDTANLHTPEPGWQKEISDLSELISTANDSAIQLYSEISESLSKHGKLVSEVDGVDGEKKAEGEVNEDDNGDGDDGNNNTA